MFEKRSGSFSFSNYDWWGVGRGLLLFIISGLVVNIDAFTQWLAGLSISPFVGTMIVWGVVDLGRRFSTDYTK